MKLKQIQIYNFGQFSDEIFDLPDGNLAAFFGENEAGKSTTVAFIKQILFGFNLKNTASSFFEDYEPLSKAYPMGGKLVFAGDGDWEIERTYSKGDKSKVGAVKVWHRGQEVPEILFYDQIQNIDGNFYADSFIFNEDLMRKLASLSEEEILENIYYLGAAESSKLLSIRSDFAKEAKDLFKASGKKAPVNQDLILLNEQKEQVAANESAFDDYQKLEVARLAKQKQLADLMAIRKGQEVELKQCEKLLEQAQNYENYLRLKRAQKDVAFDPDLYQKAVDLNAQIKALKTAAAKEVAEPVDLTDLSGAKAQLANFKGRLEDLTRTLQTNQLQYEQLEDKQRNILEFSPDLADVKDMPVADFQQLQADWEKVNAESQAEAVDEAPLAKGLPLAGGILLAAGLMILFANRTLGILLLLVGAGLLAYAFYQKGQAGQEKAAANDLKQAFAKKYGFSSSVKVDSLVTPYRDYSLNRKSMVSLDQQIQEREAELADLGQEVALFAKKTPETEPALINKQLVGAEKQLEDLADQQRVYRQKQEALSGYQKQIADLEKQLLTIFNQAKVADLASYQALAAAKREQDTAKAQIEALANSLGDQLPLFEKAGFDLAALKGKMAGLSQQLADSDRDLAALQQESANIKAEERQYADSSQVYEGKQKLAQLEEKFVRDSQNYLATLLAGEVIGRTLDLASNDRFPKMLVLAKKYFALLTGGRYQDILLPEKVSRRTPMKVVRSDKKKLAVQYLSRGTQEQLYFALKLAFVMQIRDKIDLPILIDDSFVNFDGPRTTNIVNLLNELSKNKQILVFTAREDLAKQVSEVPYRYVKEASHA